MKRVAIIGGTGIGNRLAELGGTATHVRTEFGTFRCRIVQFNDQVELVLVQRHSVGHKTPPHLVNYRAIAAGLKILGVQGCLATAAVGALRADWPSGTLVVCTDFIDFTFRSLTLWEREVKHVDFSVPFDRNLRESILRSAQHIGQPMKESGVYVGGNGPRYESPIEVAMYAKMGGDVVGMTASSEAIVLGEYAIPYACIAVVTNPGCGIEGSPLTHEEVVEEMERVGPIVVSILKGAAADFAT